MARTYLDLLLEVKESLRISRDQHVAMSIMDDAFRWFWDHHAWTGTIGEMTPFYLVPGWQIYREPLVEIPEDFRDLYEAFHVTINDAGVQTEYPLEVIANIRPTTAYGRPTAVGYEKTYAAFLLNSAPGGVVGQTYIRPRYKKGYPVDLTASAAGSNNFPLEHLEGPFKVILGWYIRNRNVEDLPKVAQVMADAKRMDSVGQQDIATPGSGMFGSLGH